MGEGGVSIVPLPFGLAMPYSLLGLLGSKSNLMVD
jgi:hypothetical protein